MRAIDGDELLGIERLLDTDVVRQSKTASWLLDQVLHDIQAMPTLTPPNEWVSVEERLPTDERPGRDGKISGKQAAKLCGMPLSSFRYRAEEFA